VEFQALYELADRELNVGLADEKILSRSLAEAKGVRALARQIYCELRAKQLRGAEDVRHLHDVVESVARQERRLLARKKRNGWLWTFACFAGFLATLVFSWFALSAVRAGTRFYPLAFLTFLSLVLTIVSLVASRYHSDA